MINRQPTQLNGLVDEAIALLDVVATQHHVELRRRIQAHLPEVLADRDKLSQVILNMIDNAIYYSRPQTVATISLRQEQGYLVCRQRSSQDCFRSSFAQRTPSENDQMAPVSASILPKKLCSPMAVQLSFGLTPRVVSLVFGSR